MALWRSSESSITSGGGGGVEVCLVCWVVAWCMADALLGLRFGMGVV